MISTTENNPINLDSILNAAEIDPGETPAEQDVNTIAIRIDDAIVLHHATDETQVCFKCRGLEWLRNHTLAVYACSMVVSGVTGIIIAKLGHDHANSQVHIVGLTIFCVTILAGSISKIFL